MKRIALSLLILTATVMAYGQGTVVFNNRVGGVVDARVVLADGTGAGVGWKAQLFGGPEGGTLVPLLPMTSFRTTSAAAAGYIVGIDLTLPGVAPGAKATFVMKAFNGNSFDASSVRYESNPFTITMGGGTLPPANLVGLQSFKLISSVASPSITTQPKSQTLVVGSTITLRVEATGTAPLTYQWQKNEAPISGATGTSLTLSNVSAFDTGNYTVVVSNSAGKLTSQVAALSIPVPANSGSVVMNNHVPGVVEARVLLADGKPAGAGWVAQLYGGPEGGTLQGLFPATTFRTSTDALGYVNSIDVAVPDVKPGAKATLVMRVFNGSSFETSRDRLESNAITIVVGGGLFPPTALVGLKTFTVVTDLKPFVERQLPASYSPGAKLLVTLQASPPSGVSVYAVEDYPPASWIVGQISDSGLYDPVNKKIKFGPFFDRNVRTLTYEVTPPSSENGQKELTGTASADGVNSAISGAKIITRAALHPADNNPADGRILISEVTAYGAAWRKGVSWPLGPSPIPIDYVTRAGTLWKNGETYTLDPKITKPPLWWVNITASKLASVYRGKAVIAPSNLGHVVSKLPPLFVPGESISVHIAVTPQAGVSVYAAQDQVPAGWVGKNISHGGEFDAINGQVKWGPFFDNTPRELSYEILVAKEVKGSISFMGFASFDGDNVAVNGERQSKASHRLRGLSRRPNGDFELGVSGGVGGQLIIEGSSDLLTWTPVATTVNADGTVSFKDPGADLKSLRFYRVKSD